MHFVHVDNLTYLIWFKLIYLSSITKQVIPTYINHPRPLIPDGIHLLFWTRFERREKADLSLNAERIEPTTSRSRGERSNHWATTYIFIFGYTLCLFNSPVCVCVRACVRACVNRAIDLLNVKFCWKLNTKKML